MEHLIPLPWMSSLPWWALLLVTAVAMGALIKGADWLVEGAAGIAERLGMPKIIVGATVVSLGTTSPEAAVSVMAAWSGNAGLALGNAVGSIIADTGLIFGIGCLLAPLPADKFVLTRQGWVQFGTAALLAAFCYLKFAMHGDAAEIGRPIGVILLVLLAVYMYFSVRWARHHPHGEPFIVTDETGGNAKAATNETVNDTPPHETPTYKLALMAFVGLVIVLAASHLLVGTEHEPGSVTMLAKLWNVPNVVIASTLVALGTSLPELVVGITAVLKGHRELLVGNVIGADILNVLFVIGASATAKPLPIVDNTGVAYPEMFLYLHLPAMMVVLVVFRLFIFPSVKRGSFKRWYGIPLIGMYLAYILLNFMLG